MVQHDYNVCAVNDLLTILVLGLHTVIPVSLLMSGNQSLFLLGRPQITDHDLLA